MQAIREKINNKLSDVTEIAAGVYRGVRKKDGREFAAYVFDLNSKLPRTVGHLSAYLDDMLGETYFSETAEADLRWNNYLYFVINNEEARVPGFDATKKILEADRSYARKYVVREEEVAQVLDELDAIALVKDSVATTDVLQTWSEKLSPRGMDDVLDESRSVADIVREISTGASKNTIRPRKVSGIEESKQLISSPLSSLSLGKFRPYPKRSDIAKLGKANLIFGANGAGKTSFMEALEFLFCGANRRSSAAPLASVSGHLRSGIVVTTAKEQPISDFKTRQRIWYGSDDNSRNNNLPNQFARFNFLNTDAAAELSLMKDVAKPGQKNNSETLADLLSGHEATEVWRRIQALQKAIAVDIRETSSSREKAQIQKVADTEKLKTLEETPSEATASFSILVKNLERMSWKALPSDAQSVAAGLDDTLAELASQLAVVRQLSWAGSDINDTQIQEKIAVFTDAMPKLRKEISGIHTSEGVAQALEDKRRLAIARRDALSAIPSDAVTNVVQLSNGLMEAKAEVSLNAKTFSTVDVHTPPEGWQHSYGQKSVDEAFKQCVANESKIKERLASQQKRLDDLTLTQTQLQNAITQVHDWARKVIGHRHSDASCPVCNSEFQPGELLLRMSEQASAPTELIAVDLKQDIERLKREILDAIGVRQWLTALFKFADTLPEGTSQKVIDTELRAREVHGRFFDLLAITTENQRRLDEYARTGLTLEKIEELCAPLEDEEVSNTDVFDIEIAKMRVAMYLQELENKKSQIENDIALQNAEVERLLAPLFPKIHESLSNVEQVAEIRLEQLRRAAEACNLLRAHLEFDSATSLSSLRGTIETAVLSAKNLISLLEKEATADTQKNALSKKLGDLNTRIEEYDASIDRLEQAADVLADIIDNHSLDAATAAVVGATHTVADSIFSRIHTPAEYRVNATPDSPLTRRDTDAVVLLNEVSTGQRAAYALSMFLAMNAQVKNGPKVMLLDDPISHIDDLNALSFLDYLRNVVLKSDRQLFFATADEKVAGLFAHKFGFLGDDFQIIELSRS